jgi:hypothetical protein
VQYLFPQHLEDLMLSSFVWLGRPGAYTTAPLQNREHEADAFNMGNVAVVCVVDFSSAMVAAGHGCGRDGVKLLGWRSSWSRLVVDKKSPNQPGIGDAPRHTVWRQRRFLLQLLLLVKPATKPDVSFPTLEDCGSTVLCQACSLSGPNSWRGRRRSLHALVRCRLCQTTGVVGRTLLGDGLVTQ